MKNDVWFDGLSLDQHAVKTIDNRYTSKREYSATKQTYISYFELALSPAYFNHFYEQLTKNFKNYLGYADDQKAPGISVSTLGAYLNSDFDEEEPYNRADAKAFTIYAFEYFANNYEKVMTSGGNAYSWQYVDYITDIALDSSRYSDSAASVPFLGIVLHGYVEFAGSPINMEGNLDYAILKTIESGAGLQFVLSYRNTENLKEDELLSQYYSINYKIWKDDLISIYAEVNEILKDLQTSTIVEHLFVDGTRVPDNDELRADAEAAVAELIAAEAEKRVAAEKEYNYNIMKARKLLKSGLNTIKTDVEEAREKLFAATGSWTVAKEMFENTSQNSNNTAELAGTLFDMDKAGREALDVLYSYLDAYEFASERYDVVKQTYESELDDFAQSLKALGEDKDMALDPEEATYYSELKALAESIIETMNDAYKAVYKGKKNFEYRTEAKAEDATNEGKDSYSKYETATNKIVYEEYYNDATGTTTAFILNFNDYAVVVTNPKTGITYTIEAYGYVVLKSSKKS